jgi:hypothetical protein
VRRREFIVSSRSTSMSRSMRGTDEINPARS